MTQSHTASLEHTGSYYAATINEPLSFPPLAGDQTADVCVVGAGFTGINTALELADRGYNVRVVEASRVGWGASGRNGGQMIGGIAGEDEIAKTAGQDVETVFSELRWLGHDIIAERVERFGIECDLKRGYLDVAIKDRHMRDLEYDLERLTRANFPYEVRLLSAAETEQTIGTDAYIGSMLNMRNGHVHPLNLCLGEARAATSLGVTIHEQSPAVRIEHGSQPKVVTAAGSVTADAIVLAGNAYHDVEPAVRGVLFPVKSFIIATEPLDEQTCNKINPQDLAVCDPNFVLEYYRLSADKRMLFGGRLNYFGDDTDFIADRLRRKLARIYPSLAGVRIDYAWGGRIGVTLNRVPQIGRLGDNVYFCQGYSGHGVNVTHITSRVLAEAISGTLERFDLFADVKPMKVPGAYRYWKPMVALGVLYYKIRDSL